MGFNPVWSPDGAKIAYASSGPERSLDVWVMDAVPRRGSDPVNLTAQIEGNQYNPVWSPDGTRIVVVSRADKDLFVMNADGSNPVRLTRDSQTLELDPSWSPDGAKITFASRGIYVMNADGSNPVQITPDTRGANPAWSPFLK